MRGFVRLGHTGAALAQRAPAAPGLRESTRVLGAARQRSIDLTQQIKRLATPQAVAELHGRMGHRFDDLNLSAAWFQVHRTTTAWSIDRKRGLLGPWPDAVVVPRPGTEPAQAQPGAVAALAAHVQRRLPHFEPRALSHAAYVAGKLDAQPLLVAIERPLTSLLDQCSPRLLANALWAFASRGVPAPELFSRARDHLLSTDALAAYNPHDLASIAWSFATAGVHDDKQLFHAIAHAASVSIESFPPNELGVLAGALTTAGAREPALLGRLIERAHAQLGALDPQSLSKLLWSIARLGACDELPSASLFDAVLQLPAHRLHALSGRELCQLIWAFNAARYLHRAPAGAGLGGAPPRAAESACLSRLPPAERQAALSRLLELALGRLPSLSADERVFVAWAFAPSSLPRVPTLLERVHAAVEPQLDSLSPQVLSMLGWAHAAAFVPSAPLLSRLTSIAAARLGEMQPQGIITLLWASLLVGGDSSALLDELGAMAPSRLDGFLASHLSMLGWALCVHRAYPPQLLRALLGRINALPLASFNVYARVQLQQLHAALGFDAAHLGLAVRPGLLEPASLRAAPLHTSNSHAALSRALRSLHVEHANEECVGGLGYPVDIVLRASRHVLQVNGPMHYLPHSRTPGPKMEFVRRHIQRAGWQVIDVPYWEIDKHCTPVDILGGQTSESLRTFLRDLLARHGAACGEPAPPQGPARRTAPAARAGGRTGGVRVQRHGRTSDARRAPPRPAPLPPDCASPADSHEPCAQSVADPAGRASVS